MGAIHLNSATMHQFNNAINTGSRSFSRSRRVSIELLCKYYGCLSGGLEFSSAAIRKC